MDINTYCDMTEAEASELKLDIEKKLINVFHSGGYNTKLNMLQVGWVIRQVFDEERQRRRNRYINNKFNH